MIDFTRENMLSWHLFFFPSGFSIDQWMPLDEFVGQPFYEEDHMSRKVIDACVAAYEDRYSGFTAHELTSKLDGQSSLLYYDCSSGAWTRLCASQGRLASQSWRPETTRSWNNIVLFIELMMAWCMRFGVNAWMPFWSLFIPKYKKKNTP